MSSCANKKMRTPSPLESVSSELSSSASDLSNSRPLESVNLSKLPISPQERMVIEKYKLKEIMLHSIDSIGYFATPCVSSALNKLFKTDQIRLDFFRVFTQTPSVTTATLLRQPTLDTWQFHCSYASLNYLVSLRTNIMSRDRLFLTDWDVMLSSFRSDHDELIQEYVEVESIAYDHYVAINIIDENWDRIYRIAERVPYSFLYNDLNGEIKIQDQKKKIQYRTYFIPAFNRVPFPSFDTSYLSRLSELEHWIYFLKHAHILATKPIDLSYPSLSQVYDLMDMELWTNDEILEYVDELMTKYNSFTVEEETVEPGVDALLALWPLSEETPPVPREALIFDARSLLLSQIPSFRQNVLPFCGFLKVLKPTNSHLVVPQELVFPLEFRREMTCREKLNFAIEVRASTIGFNMTRDIRLALKEGKDYKVELNESYRSLEFFPYILKSIEKKLGIE